MHTFFAVFLLGIAVGCAFAGWGSLVVSILKIRFSTGVGFDAAVGIALTTAVGAFLNLFQLISPRVVQAWVGAGVLLLFVAAMRSAGKIGEAFTSLRTSLKHPQPYLLLVFGIVAVSGVKFAASVSPAVFHTLDDLPAYLVYPTKMLQTGSLGNDPFSERRVMSSLGGNYFLDAVVAGVTGDPGNLRMMDEGISFLIMLLLLTEIMRHNKVRRIWLLTVLLAVSAMMAPISNLTAVYGAAVLLLLIFQMVDTGVQSASMGQAVFVGLIFASLMSLKTTFAPVSGLLFLSLYGLQAWITGNKRRAVVHSAVSGSVILLLLWPWMVASHHSSGTWFYPLLGKGYHGSQYGIYLLPTAQMGFRNFLAFCSGLSGVLGVMLFVEICSLAVIFTRRIERERMTEAILAVNLVIDIVFIGAAIGGLQMYRYTFAILFSVAIFLLIKLLALSSDTSSPSGAVFLTDRTIAVLLLGLLLGSSWEDYLTWQKKDGAKALVASVEGTSLSTPAEIEAYRQMQLSVPAGAKLLVRLDKNFLLDFRRNPVYIDDLPGGASLPPGIPMFAGSEPVATYFLRCGIRYVAYSYGDEASFSRATFKDRLAPRVNVWLRKGAEIAWDFQDNLVALGHSRRKLYDDGYTFVLDLATAANPGAPAATETASGVKRPAPEMGERTVPASSEPIAAVKRLAFEVTSPMSMISAPAADKTVTLNPAMTTEELQTGLSYAGRGAPVQFAAGAYHLQTTLKVPCKDLQISGPEGMTPTANLSAQFRNATIFAFEGGCRQLGSMRNLHFDGTGAVYFGAGDNSHFIFEHNLVTGLPSGLDNTGAEAGLFFDGSLDTKLSDITIRFNTFGSPDSCKAVFATPRDEGGHCAGLITSQGEISHLFIDHNNFLHVEEGIHLKQLASFAPGKKNSVCVGCVIDYNYVAEYHRIGIEVQVSTPTDPIMIEHNAVVDPVQSSWGTYAVSLACCQSGSIIGVNGHSPALIFNDNVLVASKPIGSECPPYGVEFWGTGAQGLNSLVQGTFCNGYTWGYGTAPWAIKANFICGPNFEKHGGFITNQQKQNNPPEQVNNTTDARCRATPSHKPAMSPAGGAISGSQVVTLSDPGMNTSIWYTTDGSTPIPGAATTHYYDRPFTISTSTTVKAVGMWGARNQPVRYPAGYGYVPSEIVSATYALNARAVARPGSLRLAATALLHGANQ
jgi:hypothetical protein